MKSALAAVALACCFAVHAYAGDIPARDGWKVHDTQQTYSGLIDKLKASIKGAKMGLVTQAGPTGMAKKRVFEILGSRIFGVYRNDFAVRAIRLSISSMIEAPIRMYVTENSDGTATLSYKTPTHVFTPYFDEGGAELKTLAGELDTIFAGIAANTVK